MKETIKINLNQRLFDLDADAYSKLKEYLDTLRRYFNNKPDEAEEILQDIEQRIAEILTEKLRGDKQVITLSDIEEIIQMMGTVDDFAMEEDSSQQKFQQSNDNKTKKENEDYSRDHRRLHRDLESNIFGGVCAGVAAFFNTDPVWIRLIFVLFFFLNGVGFLVYLILWAVVPAARTTAQRLQMKGRPVTVETITDSVKSEYEKVKDNFNRYSQSESFQKARKTANEIFSGLGQILLVTLKIILILIGAGCIIALIFFMLGIAGILTHGGWFNGFNIHGFQLNDQIAPLFHDLTLFSLALTVVILIPLIAILAGTIKMIFNIRTHYGVLSAFAWTIWSLALVYVIISALSDDRIISKASHQKLEYKLDIDRIKALNIKVNKEILTGWNTEYYTFFGEQIIHDKRKDLCYLEPHLDIRPSDDNTVRLMIEHTSAIPHLRNRYEKDYEYFWHQNDTLLLLDNYYSIDQDLIWSLPSTTIILLLPENQKVLLDPSLRKLLLVNSVSDHNIPLFDYMIIRNCT